MDVGDLYVGGCREHSGPFLVWHEAFSWTLDQLAARPEADKAPPSHDHLLTLQVLGSSASLASAAAEGWAAPLWKPRVSPGQGWSAPGPLPDGH